MKLWDTVFDKPTFKGLNLVLDDAEVLSCGPMEGVPDSFVLEGVLTGDECEQIIQKTEAMGYTYWNPEDPSSRDFRSAWTVEIAYPKLADAIWKRLRPHFQFEHELNEDDERWEAGLTGSWIPCGIYNKMLFARYRDGQHFAPHSDGATILDPNLRSFFPVLIYLNHVEGGGGTKFLEDLPREKLIVHDEQQRSVSCKDYILTEVHPKPGRCAVFYHSRVHEGSPVKSGTQKYVLRTDMLFRRKEPILMEPSDQEAFQLWMEAERISELGKTDEGTQLFRRALKMSPALATLYGM